MTAGEGELECLAARLRDRVAQRCYGEAQAALDEYCGALRKTVAGLPPGDSQLGRLQEDGARLLEETRRRVLAGRAHAGLRLARLPKPTRPYGEGPQPRRTWQCLA